MFSVAPGSTLRQNGNPAITVGNTYFVPTGAQTNVTSGGNGSNPARAAWGLDYSLMTQISNGAGTTSTGGLTLADVHLIATMSDELGHSFAARSGPRRSAQS